MLGRGPKRNGRQHERLDAKVTQGHFGRRLAEALHKPGVEVDGEVRALLLGTSGRQNREAAAVRPLSNFLEREVTEAHARA